MKKLFFIPLICTILMIIPCQKANAYMVKYKEDYYKLYHIHYQQKPDDCMENIYWLEQAVKADFCNPQYVDFKITNEKQWEKYRYLFQMHLNLKLIEQHLRLGRIYDKKCVYFYDSPWKEEYKRNLEKTLSCYQAGLYYWKEAKIWCEKAGAPSFNFLYITEKQNWEDEKQRIQNGELDYETILNREISRVQKNLDELKSLPDQY